MTHTAEQALEAYYLVTVLLQKGQLTGHRACLSWHASESDAVAHYTQDFISQGYAVIGVEAIEASSVTALAKTITSQAAKIERLTRELAASKMTPDFLLQKSAQEISRLTALLETAVKVVEPFAIYSAEYDRRTSNGGQLPRTGDVYSLGMQAGIDPISITVESLQAAASFLSTIKEQNNG